jgi:hypothetical protein
VRPRGRLREYCAGIRQRKWHRRSSGDAINLSAFLLQKGLLGKTGDGLGLGRIHLKDRYQLGDLQDFLEIRTQIA